MRRSLTTMLVLVGVSGLLGLAGCGGGPSSGVPEQAQPAAEPADEEPQEAEPAASHEILGSTIRIADPEGRWTFRAEADRMEAESLHGPYTLEPARAVYEEVGKAPIHMTADRARVDEELLRAVFEGHVVVASEGGWQMEAPRVEYDLDTGEVVAAGRTK